MCTSPSNDQQRQSQTPVGGFREKSVRLYPESLHFRPMRESVPEIIDETQPCGRDVLSVAAFGYPFAFLAAGARRVLSVDVDHRQFAWNQILRGVILELDHAEALDFMLRKHTLLAPARVLERILPRISSPFQEEGAVRFLEFLFYEPDLGNIIEIYPFLRDAETYQQVHLAIHEGHLVQECTELLSLLAGMEPARKFDVMFLSSVRNWVLHHQYDKKEAQFATHYDQPLAAAIRNRLNADGVVLEALIKPQELPKVPLPDDLYEFLDIRVQSSRDPVSGSLIVTGHRRL